METPTDLSPAYAKQLRRIHNYYTTLTFSPVDLCYAQNRCRRPKSGLKIFLYFLSRFLVFLNIFHLALLFFGGYKSVFGELDTFGLLETSMWLIGWSLYFMSDPFLVSVPAAVSTLTVMDGMDRLWQKVSGLVGGRKLEKLLKILRKRRNRCFFHAG